MEIKTCEEYVIKKLFSLEEEFEEEQRLHLTLRKEHQKALNLIELIKKHAKVQYNTIWINLYDVEDRQQLLNALGLKEEQPNE